MNKNFVVGLMILLVLGLGCVSKVATTNGINTGKFELSESSLGVSEQSGISEENVLPSKGGQCDGKIIRYGAKYKNGDSLEIHYYADRADPLNFIVDCTNMSDVYYTASDESFHVQLSPEGKLVAYYCPGGDLSWANNGELNVRIKVHDDSGTTGDIIYEVPQNQVNDYLSKHKNSTIVPSGDIDEAKLFIKIAREKSNEILQRYDSGQLKPK